MFEAQIPSQLILDSGTDTTYKVFGPLSTFSVAFSPY